MVTSTLHKAKLHLCTEVFKSKRRSLDAIVGKFGKLSIGTDNFYEFIARNNRLVLWSRRKRVLLNLMPFYLGMKWKKI